MDADEILLEAEERMEGAVNHLGTELRGLRSGRASPALVDQLKVPPTTPSPRWGSWRRSAAPSRVRS